MHTIIEEEDPRGGGTQGGGFGRDMPLKKMKTDPYITKFGPKIGPIYLPVIKNFPKIGYRKK